LHGGKMATSRAILDDDGQPPSMLSARGQWTLHRLMTSPLDSRRRTFISLRPQSTRRPHADGKLTGNKQ